MTADERRDARAHRNRLAAQGSRDRKKAQFEQLSLQVSQLEEENRSLRLGLVSSSSSSSASVDAALAKENKELRERIQQLEQAWQNMTKILGAMSIPVPQQQQQHPVLSNSIPSDPSLPLSPAPTASPKSEPTEVVVIASEPTCELARFANVSTPSRVETSLQRVAPSARSSIIRLLSEQSNWERPRCSISTPLLDTGTSILLCC